MDRRRQVRFALLLVALVLFASLGVSYVTATEQASADRSGREERVDSRTGQKRIAPATSNTTVITTVAFQEYTQSAEIMAISPDGRVTYYNDTYDSHWDVEPTPPGSNTVLYSAAEKVTNESLCADTPCLRNVVERVNLSTGAVTRLYSRVESNYHNSEWHDVDRINGTHLLVADMLEDRVFVVNTSSGAITWEWEAQSHYSLDAGGPYPDDWSHVNDVELLDDGRIMMSPRNMDEVLFIDRKTGRVRSNWTLGAEDDHATLYEQHNPDYIPESNGGPAVLVADSENNRIVEYQRTEAGTWQRSWAWRDDRLQWPRDADRLPNDHTLVTDTHGDRVVETNERGDVVWSVDVMLPYEAERLETGDGSTNGTSATAAGLASRGGDTTADSGKGSVLSKVTDRLPPKLVNGILFVIPRWMGLLEVVMAALLVLVLGLLAALELYWSPLSVHVRYGKN